MYLLAVFCALYMGKKLLFIFQQLLPRRLDWLGNEHPRTYEDVVRFNFISVVKFIVGGCYCLVTGGLCVHAPCLFTVFVLFPAGTTVQGA